MKVSELIGALAAHCRAENVEEAAAIARLRRAQKFKLQLSGEALHASVDYAHQMKKFGLFQLPFDECYFEGEPSTDDEDGERHAYGVLCWREGDRFLGRSYVWGEQHCNTGRVTFDLLGLPRKGERPIIAQGPLFAPYWPDVTPLLGETLHKEEPEYYQVGSALGAMLAFAGVGSLTLVGVSREKVDASQKLNKARSRRGKEPIYSHTVVRVAADPGRVGGISGGMLHRDPPRLHWRRGHIRRLPSGKLAQVRPCLVGDRTAGIVTHDYTVAA